MARGDHIIANSKYTRNHIIKTHGADPKDITVIYRGVDMKAFDPAKVSDVNRKSKRSDWGVQEGQIAALLPGRLTRWKGQLIAVQALAKLPDDYVLIFQGDAQGRNAYVNEIKQLASDLDVVQRVRIMPHSPDIAISLAAADIVISASTDPEAFGRIAVEAQAMGTPVIATAHGGSLETIIEGVTGELVPSNDVKALANGVLKAVQMKQGRITQKNRSHIARNFSKTAMQNQTLAVYEKLLGGGFSRDKT